MTADEHENGEISSRKVKTKTARVIISEENYEIPVKNDEKSEEIVENKENITENTKIPVKNDERMSNDELIDAIRRTLTVPKSKDSLPTLTMYSAGFFKRYMILDVDGDAYAKGWEIYRAERPDASAQGYIMMVTSILSMDLPRMYRDVSFVPLS